MTMSTGLINIRIHGTFGYLSPMDYKLEHLKKVV